MNMDELKKKMNIFSISKNKINTETYKQNISNKKEM